MKIAFLLVNVQKRVVCVLFFVVVVVVFFVVVVVFFLFFYFFFFLFVCLFAVFTSLLYPTLPKQSKL